jgi:hypothetical protein
VFSNTGVVTAIRIHTGGGNDIVNYTQSKALATGQSRKLTIDMGTGHDKVNVTLNSGLASKAQFKLKIFGGTRLNRINVTGAGTIAASASLKMNLSAGGDANRINVTEGSRVVSGASLVMNLNAGGNSNLLDVTQNGQVTGILKVISSTSGQYETIDTMLTPAGGSSGTLTAKVFGGPGRDALRLLARKGSEFDKLAFDAVVNGGGGIDTCTHTTNVTSVNCEINHVVV